MRTLFFELIYKMIELISRIAPDVQFSFSKLSPVFAVTENLIAFVIDFVEIELFEYNRKDKKVSQNHLSSFYLDIFFILIFKEYSFKWPHSANKML